jgi:hypothetical protein
MFGSLARHARSGEFPQFVIHEGEQFGGGAAIASGRGIEEAGHIGHASEYIGLDLSK